jgi:hypothetical protein
MTAHRVTLGWRRDMSQRLGHRVSKGKSDHRSTCRVDQTSQKTPKARTVWVISAWIRPGPGLVVSTAMRPACSSL